MELLRQKNVASRIVFPLISTVDRPEYFTGTAWGSLTNASVTAYSWQDGQAAATLAISGTPTELGSTGLWELALTQGEMNPDSGSDDYIVVKLNADEIDEQTVLIILQDYDVKTVVRAVDDEGNTLANEAKQDTIDTVVDAIKAVTDNLPDSGALSTIDSNVDAILADTGTDGVVLADDAITAAKFDETTAFPLESADSGSTEVARTGADGDTLETLSDQLDAVETDTQDIQSLIGTPVDLGDGATLADNNTSLAGKTASAASYDRTTDSQEAIRDRGDSAWATGEGGIEKGVNLDNFTFLMVDSTDHVTPKTGLTVTGSISKDGAAFASLTNAVSEVGNGVYKVNLDGSGDLDIDFGCLRFTATGADARYISFKTES